MIIFTIFEYTKMCNFKKSPPTENITFRFDDDKGRLLLVYFFKIRNEYKTIMKNKHMTWRIISCFIRELCNLVFRKRELYNLIQTKRGAAKILISRPLQFQHWRYQMKDFMFSLQPKRIQAALTHRVYWKALRSSLRCHGRRVE